MPLEDYVYKNQKQQPCDTWADKAVREVQLLGVGVAAIPEAAVTAFTERPGETGLKITAAAGLAFALRCAISKGGVMRSLAQSAGVGFTASTVGDFGRNIGPIAGAFTDNLDSTDNWNANAAVMKDHFAPFVFDTTLAVGAGVIGGYGAARFTRPRTFEPTLPEFNRHGLLPQGIHQASWQEFSARYGSNARRQDLLANMEVLLHLAKKHGGSTEKVYVGGSFVTAKETPADFDMTWRLCGSRFEELQKTAPLLVDRTLQMKELGGQLMATYPNAIKDSPSDGVLGFLQRNARLQMPVGLVEIDLSTIPCNTSYRLRTLLGTAGPRPILTINAETPATKLAKPDRK